MSTSIPSEITKPIRNSSLFDAKSPQRKKLVKEDSQSTQTRKPKKSSQKKSNAIKESKSITSIYGEVLLSISILAILEQCFISINNGKDPKMKYEIDDPYGYNPSRCAPLIQFIINEIYRLGGEETPFFKKLETDGLIPFDVEYMVRGGKLKKIDEICKGKDRQSFIQEKNDELRKDKSERTKSRQYFCVLLLNGKKCLIESNGCSCCKTTLRVLRNELHEYLKINHKINLSFKRNENDDLVFGVNEGVELKVGHQHGLYPVLCDHFYTNTNTGNPCVLHPNIYFSNSYFSDVENFCRSLFNTYDQSNQSKVIGDSSSQTTTARSVLTNNIINATSPDIGLAPSSQRNANFFYYPNRHFLKQDNYIMSKF
ncbi:hypothetical protein QTN25_004864 [Entamoeba marina]